MNEKETDLRVLRTKESIKNSFIELMNEKKFEKITVKDITMRAKINRGTFYIHYLDKYDLMKKMQEEIIEEMTYVAKDNILDFTSKENQTTIPLNGIVAIFKYIEDNKEFMTALLCQQGDLSFQVTVKDFLWKNLFDEQSGLSITEMNLHVPKDFLISYISSAHLGVIKQWLKSGMKESPEEMAKILATITIEGPLGAAGFKETVFKQLLEEK